jgi:LmbE family N-acetylglucosaminyl deacetylase
MRRITLGFLLLILTFTAGPGAQHRLQPVQSLAGRPGLELMLRKLDTVGSFMMTTAHPDDENNAMLAYFSHGKGYRATLVTATHGEGGQNEIGPELFEALAVLRTEELAAAHRYDGAEQYFTRAIDFGYSFSIEESLEKWGKQEILGDFVRMIRTIRPDVIVGFVFDGAGGGQHHQASSRITLEAFRAAADPQAFPEQMQDGLRPWQPKKFYYTAGFGGPRGGQSTPLPGDGAPTPLMFAGGDDFDPILGRTYNEIAGEARSMHKCQGMSQLLPLPAGNEGFGGGVRAYRLRDTVLDGGVARPEKGVFDGIETSLTSLVGYAGDNAPAELASALARITALAADARKGLASGGEAATVAPLARGLSAVRELRGALPKMGLSESARYEIDVRLEPKEQQFAEALLLATDVRLDAVARDGLVVRGQTVPVDLMAANRGASRVELSAAIGGFAPASAAGQAAAGAACDKAELAPGSKRACNMTPTIPAEAQLTAAHFRTGTEGARYVFDGDVPFGLPFRPTPYTATFTLSVEGVPFTVTRPIQFRSEGNIFSGEKRAEMHVVPKFAVSVTPDVAIAAPGREVRVTVTNHSKGVATADVRLQLPQGWRATPSAAPVTFSREDESMAVKFVIQPAPNAKGTATLEARVVEGGVTYNAGYQVVEYPHTTRRHVLRAPDVRINAVDLKVKPNLTIGYVMGVGDEVPEALEQLGARVELIGEDDLAWGDLNHYSVIMTGVRAYERRGDLRAYNHRIIEYARAGGTVIVNYNKFEFNETLYGPYPARVSSTRVTDENAPVHVLQPEHPVFNTPNKLSDADWQHWVQERGLYFLDTERRDPQYVDLISFDEPFPYNKGTKLGGLVEAKVDGGRWIYLGIGLWRQLPAGTDGAYRLMANLISLGKQAPAQTR